jgi:hypothetical protein
MVDSAGQAFPKALFSRMMVFSQRLVGGPLAVFWLLLLLNQLSISLSTSRRAPPGLRPPLVCAAVERRAVWAKEGLVQEMLQGPHFFVTWQSAGHTAMLQMRISEIGGQRLPP